jgi:hypothetical protein
MEGIKVDDVLRAKGFEIRSRPNEGENLWEIPGVAILPESQAVASVEEWEQHHRPQLDCEDALPRALLCAVVMFACLLIGAALTAIAKADLVPDKEPPPKKVETPPLTYETQWGAMAQRGKTVSIDGPVWMARGEVRDDGSVFLLWTELSSGRVAPSVYNLRSGQLAGDWGFAPEAFVNADGSMGGALRQDRIIKIHPPPDN